MIVACTHAYVYIHHYTHTGVIALTTSKSTIQNQTGTQHARTCRGDAGANQLAVGVHGTHQRSNKHGELRIRCVRLARREKVLARVCVRMSITCAGCASM